MIKLCDKEFQRLESVDREKWDYFDHITSSQKFTLKSVGIYSSSKNNYFNYFAIDTIDSNGRFYRYVYRYSPDSDIPSTLTRWVKVDWTSLLNQKICIEHYGNWVLLRDSMNNFVCVNYYGNDQRINNFINAISDKQIGKKVVEKIVNIDNDSEGEVFITYKVKRSKRYYYFGSEIAISTNGLEGKQINKEIYTLDYGIDEDTAIADLTQRFYRTKEEIIRFTDENIAGSTELKDYIKDKDSAKNNGDLIGAFIRGGHGQAIISDGVKWINYPTDEADLFKIIGRAKIPTKGIVFTLKKHEGKWTSAKKCEKEIEPICSIIEEEINKNDLFRSYLSQKKEEITLQAKFEDITNLGRSFNSYYFIIGTPRKDHKYKRTEFLQYLMYMKHLENVRIEEEKHKRSLLSAIATIMSRNMSHNLGSHVLHYSRQNLHLLSQKVTSLLYDLDNPFSANSKDDLKNIVETSVIPYINGAEMLIGLMQDRMHYLAAITSGYKMPNLPVSYWSLYKFLTCDEIENSDGGDESIHYGITNFYLSNLVRSDGFTRHNFLVSESSIESTTGNIRIISSAVDRRIQDNPKIIDIKDIMLGLPGGIISAQAFYNIFENFVRNSAKYKDPSIYRSELEIHINFRQFNDDQYELTIFDNLHNARVIDPTQNKTRLDILKEKLDALKFVDSTSGQIDECSKGLKEMYLSALWLRSNINRASTQDILYDRDTSSTHQIESPVATHPIRYVAVDDHGTNAPKEDTNANLGIRMYLPCHQPILMASDCGQDDNEIVESLEKQSTDIVLVDNEKDFLLKLCPLALKINKKESSDYSVDSSLVTELIKRRIPNIDEYKLYFGGYSETDEVGKEPIYFGNHFNKATIQSSLLEKMYLDSISGANYTKLLERKLVSCDPDSDERKILIARIKESALTRITIIDERAFKTVRWSQNEIEAVANGINIKGHSFEQSLRGIRLLTYSEEDGGPGISVEGLEVFRGNHFHKPYKHELEGNIGIEDHYQGDNSNFTDFLSIHLSTIEKILKGSEKVNKMIDEKLLETTGEVNTAASRLSSERVHAFMTILQDVFSDKHPERLYISVHSGRGGINQELREPLKDYPFVSVSTILGLLNDSKFLLTQMFNNLLYKYKK